MKRRLVYIIAIIVITLCASAAVISCSEEKAEYAVRYKSTDGGYVYYLNADGTHNDCLEEIVIAKGGAAPEIYAVPEYGCRFVEWSDGVTTATRKDTNITSDMTVTAIFKRKEYTLEYAATSHGHIEGETKQTVEQWEDGQTVTAVPEGRGYEFVKWSDGVTTAQRTDKCVERNILVTAEFAYIRREYALNDRKTLNSEINKPKITLEYDGLEGVKLPVPQKERFTFKGWYYGDEKIADEHGELLVGNEFVAQKPVEDILGNKQDIEAKWQANETYTFKILIVYVTKIQAQLYDRYGNSYDIDYTMTELQRKFCEESTKLLEETMNEMCDGLVDFRIDEYYTMDTITNEEITQSRNPTMPINTSLIPRDIPEIQDMRKDYDTVVSVFGFGGDKPTPETVSLFEYDSGGATLGECEVYFDGFIYSTIIDRYELTDILNGKGRTSWLQSLEVFIHEIAHTIELRIKSYDYHRFLTLASNCEIYDTLIMNRLYYLNSIEVDGELVGIPYEFWKGEIAKVEYTVTRDEHGNMGYVFYEKSQEVVYGWDAREVEAEPFLGYRFIKWSDGITTPKRKDKNITSDFTVTAIFEPIIYTVRVTASEGGYIRLLGSEELSVTIDLQAQWAKRTKNVIAVAKDGYRFVGWSDGTTDDVWSKFIQITDLAMFDENNMYNLTAVFEKIE